jgi:XTP/dITP diphosphohydrolase
VTAPPAEEWTLATTNSGKLAEFRALFASTPINLRGLGIDRLEPPEETGSTFVENALIKARHAARVTAKPALADDSGLCVEALGGAPGVFSARFAGPGATDSDNIERLLRELEGIEAGRRRAAFYCVIVALRSPDDPIPVIATGRWPGLITLEPRGTGGFGYDPVFWDPERGLTAAELSADRKNRVSHRGRACAELLRQLGF